MNAAKLIHHPSTAPLAERAPLASAPAPAEEYLGPAVVSARSDAGVRVALSDGRQVEATMALALPYEARERDVLLVIGRGDAFYVIGVLSGSGRTELAFHGDVTLHAVGGVAEITGDAGVRVRGPQVDVQAGALRVVAETVVETLSTLVQRVAESLTVYARSSHTIVEEGAYTQAKTAAIRTEETMSINGKQVLLG
jgi:hypothetical protein